MALEIGNIVICGVVLRKGVLYPLLAKLDTRVSRQFAKLIHVSDLFCIHYFWCIHLRYRPKLLYPGWIQQFICVSRVDTTKIKDTKQIGYMYQYCKLSYPRWIHVYPVLLKLDTKPLFAKPPRIYQGCHHQPS